MDAAAVIRWIRKNELPWAPGCADLAATVPWSTLRQYRDNAELVEKTLEVAIAELNTVSVDERAEAVHHLAARRLIPDSTMTAYGRVIPTRAHTAGSDCADGHVHQGAALPLEVTLHWVSGALSSIASGRSPIPLPMTDTAGEAFNPAPLLLLLRCLVERPDVASTDALDLVVSSARGDLEAWDRVNSVLGFDAPADQAVPYLADIERLKIDARRSWTPERRVALLRIEAILHGAVTQRQAGLDLFVELFEQFAALRRGRLPKEEYYRRSIDAHVTRSHHRLRRLELRLGEPIARSDVSNEAIENEYKAALCGYRAHIGSKNDPVYVTFPLGLVKSRRGHGAPSEHWQFNPGGIYSLIESLLDVLSRHPPLAPFIDGIDVCGWEEGEPNWLFSPAFERFGRRTTHLTPPPACRFHAGEWQWTPLHGLRRIGEFLAFRLPALTPRRIGHGLAMCSTDWQRIGDQPADELLDDLLWARTRLNDVDSPAAVGRIVDRLILDLRSVAHEDDVIVTATPQELCDAYQARFEVGALEKISFINCTSGGRLSFPDRAPTVRSELRLQLLSAHLRKRKSAPRSVLQTVTTDGAIPGVSLNELRSTLAELYDLLAPEIVDDVRWGGVVVEACPTSNVLAGGVRGHVKHPMRRFVERGVLATVNTDDPSLFHSWLPDELGHAEERMGVPVGQVRRSRRLSVRLIAPAFDALEVSDALDRAIHSLEHPPMLS